MVIVLCMYTCTQTMHFNFDPLLTQLGTYAAADYAFYPTGAISCWSKYVFRVDCLLFSFYLAHSLVSVDPVTNISLGSVFKPINQEMRVGGIFCDWAKVSDCVNHDIVLAKLHFYGI